MATLYVTSSQIGAGKTLVCAGLAKHLAGDGKKVGFLKPLIADEKGSVSADAKNDAIFMKKVMALAESVDEISPLIGKDKLADGIKQACAMVAKGKDVVIVEGVSLKDSGEIVKSLDAKVLGVEGYDGQLPVESYQGLGNRLLGVVMSRVPKNKVESVTKELTAKLNQAKINLLGVLPEDRVLFAITVGELAEYLKGKIVNSTEKSSELVENVMLGAMTVDPGIAYFGRKNNKAVVVRADRPDMQLAALQTSTRCLILNSDTAPIPAVIRQAEAKKVPVILVKGQVEALATVIEEAVSQARFNQEKKLSRLSEIMGQRFNFPALYQGLQLAK